MTTIYKEQLKSAEWNLKTNQVEPSDYQPLILSEEIIIDINFDSNVGFTFSYPDFKVETTDIEYHKALKSFHNAFYNKLKYLASLEKRNEDEQKDWVVAKKLMTNLDALKK